MTRIWGIHMPAWVGDDPVETGRAYIGWPRVGDILQIPGSRLSRWVFERRLAGGDQRNPAIRGIVRLKNLA